MKKQIVGLKINIIKYHWLKQSDCHTHPSFVEKASSALQNMNKHVGFIIRE